MESTAWLKALPAPALVVAAHPDDEVIGAGALLRRLSRASVVHVTDGAPRNASDARKAGFADWPDYAAARRREALAALALAGIPAERVLSLGVADQEASLQLAALAGRVAEQLREHGFAAIITHAYEGGHPDHDATAFAVHAACQILARDGQDAPPIFEMAGYHAFGAPFVAGSFLPREDAGPIVLFDLDQRAQKRKRAMFDCHASQRPVLAQFTVGQERFRRAPRYDFTAPPHPGTLHYETQDWGMSGERWRRLAAAALEELHIDAPL